MPQRRLKTLLLALVAGILILLYITTGASSTRSSEFYTRTVAAMNAKAPASDSSTGTGTGAAFKDIAAANAKVPADKDSELDIPKLNAQKPLADTPKVDAVTGEKIKDVAADTLGTAKDAVKDTANSVKDTANSVKDTANSAANAASDAVTGEKWKEAIKNSDTAPATGEKSIAGRKKYGASGTSADTGTDGRKVIKAGGDDNDGVAKVGNTGKSVVKEKEDAESADKEVEIEMDAILKKSPVIIFSKSYCPYSKKAKHILTDLYAISPPPYIEELDLHPLGPKLQAALLKMTGRRTVPNVLVNGKSIGGGDDIAELDHEGKLADTIRELGGKRVVVEKVVGGKTPE